MKLHLVRHGQTDANIGDFAQGNVNNPINATGEAQARELAKHLHGRTFDAYYVSPMRRAQQTAKIATEGRADFKVDDRLRERNFGELEEKPISPELRDRLFDLKLNTNEYGVEPIRDVFARTKSFLDELLTAHSPDDEILIVAHGISLRALHHNILGYDENTDLRSGRFENAELRSYEIDDHGARVIGDFIPTP